MKNNQNKKLTYKLCIIFVISFVIVISFLVISIYDIEKDTSQTVTVHSSSDKNDETNIRIERDDGFDTNMDKDDNSNFNVGRGIFIIIIYNYILGMIVIHYLKKLLYIIFNIKKEMYICGKTMRLYDGKKCVKYRGNIEGIVLLPYDIIKKYDKKSFFLSFDFSRFATIILILSNIALSFYMLYIEFNAERYIILIFTILIGVVIYMYVSAGMKKSYLKKEYRMLKKNLLNDEMNQKILKNSMKITYLLSFNVYKIKDLPHKYFEVDDRKEMMEYNLIIDYNKMLQYIFLYEFGKAKEIVEEMFTKSEIVYKDDYHNVNYYSEKLFLDVILQQSDEIIEDDYEKANVYSNFYNIPFNKIRGFYIYALYKNDMISANELEAILVNRAKKLGLLNNGTREYVSVSQVEQELELWNKVKEMFHQLDTINDGLQKEK